MDSLDSCRISVPGSTQEHGGRQSIFAYGAITLFGRLSHTFPLTDCFVTSVLPVLQPQFCKQSWFGLFRVRSPLLAESFLFLWVLRCFSSPGSLPQVYVFNKRIPLVHNGWFPYSETLGYSACTRLPEDYRSVPRPSSALDAKASTISS